MKRILFTIFLILTFAISYAYSSDEHSWSGESMPQAGSYLPVKEVSLELERSKRVVVGFSSSDVSLGETKIGAFDEVSTLIDSVGLTLDSEGHASIHDGFYIFYQFVTDKNVEVFLYTDGPLTGEDTNNTNEIDFKVYRTHSDDPDNPTVFIDTAANIGVGQEELGEHIYGHPNGRYAWGDGIKLHVETEQDKSFFDLPADRYSTDIYALVRSGG